MCMGIELWHSIMDHVWFPQRIVSKKRAKNAKTLLSNFGKAIVRFQLKDFFSFALWSMIWIYLLICCALNKTIWKFFAKAQLKGGSMFCVSESKLPALSYIPIFFSRERGSNCLLACQSIDCYIFAIMKYFCYSFVLTRPGAITNWSIIFCPLVITIGNGK